MSNPLVAEKQDSTSAISGITFLEGGKAIKDGIESGNWASAAMGAVGVGMDAIAFVADPFGSILAAGVGWLMEHVGPLKEALDKLAGDPDQITAHSETWKNIAKEVGAVSADLANQVKADIQSWTGPGADAYRKQAGEVAKTLDGTAQACDGAASGVKTAGEVVASVRMLVRDIIAQVVGHMVSWALQVLFTAGIGMAWVLPQVVNLVAKTAKQIAELIKSLTKALKALGQLLGKAGKLFADAGKALKGLKPGEKAKPGKVDGLGSGGKSGETTPSGAAKGGDETPAPKDDGPKDSAPKDTADDANLTPKSGESTPPAERSAGNDGETGPSAAQGKDNWVCKTDPVDVVRGNVIVDEADLSMPSPLTLERLHVSSYRAGRWFGPSWTSTVDQRLESRAGRLRFFSSDGRVLVYPQPPVGGSVLPLHGPRRPLALSEDGHYTLTDPLTGKELRFGALPGRGRAEFALQAIADADGARVEIDYDATGAPRVLRHSAGYRVELETGGGRVTAIEVVDPERDFRVLVRRFGYDEHGRLTSVVNASGRPHGYDYDDAGRITGWQDRNGVWYRYVYDADGRCVRTVGDQGFYDGAFAYDTARRVTTFTDSLGHTSEFHFNDADQVVREVDQLGNVTASAWDSYDRLISRTDPLGRTTRYEYTDEGALVAVVRADGSRARIRQDPDGTLTVTVAGDGRQWERSYPPGTAPDLFAAPAAPVFDQNAQWGPRPTTPSAADPVQRDLFGRPRVVTDEAGGVTRLDWTVDGYPAGRIGPLGRRQEWRYDAEGNRVEEAGATRRTRYEYGPFDLPVAAVDPAGGRTTYAYDTELRTTRVTNPAGLSWHYTYDAAGRLVEETDFDGRVLRFGYDAAGQLVRSVNGIGEVTTFAYDALGNLVRRMTPGGTTTYEYDPVGLLVRATNPGSVLEIERDERGRVVREAVNGRAVTYSHDSHTLHRRTPSGMDSAWTFDDDGNAVSLAAGGHIVSFRYDAAGREVERATDGGFALSQTFDAEHQLTGQTVVTPEKRVVQQRRYHYHPDGHLTAVDDAVSGPVRYQFDAVGRVTGVAAADSAEAYRYGPAGAIAQASGEAGPRVYAANRLSSTGNVSYTHDPQGRLVARQEGGRVWAYGWDSYDRLIGVRTPDGATWHYTYDPLGRRIAKRRMVAGSAVAEEIEFVWSGQNLVEQIHRDGQGRQLVLTWDYHPGTTRPVTQTEQLGAGVRFFSFVTDQVGAPVDMVDARGALAWHGTKTLWGKAKPQRLTGAGTPLRFPGQYADDETGLHYNVFRYYDPATGRYLSQDPLGLAPAPDPVSYVRDPLLQADPLGLGCGSSKEAAEEGAGDGGARVQQRPPATNDATNVQSANPVSKLPDAVKPKPKSEFEQKIEDYKGKLELEGDPKIVRIPKDSDVKLNTPVSELPANMKQGLKPEDENKMVGELMGHPRESLNDPSYGNTPVKEILSGKNEGAYSNQGQAMVVKEDASDRTIFHEMGHIKQEQNGFRADNTENKILEYHNVLNNENRMDGPPRDNYLHEDVFKSRQGTWTWDEMRADAEGSTSFSQNGKALDEIETKLQDPKYDGNRDQIKQNLVDEYFKDKPKPKPSKWGAVQT